eukprot:TRINITY_DN62865_c0_g1_i1.p1 TRINITY_DN62865_c0_g1~~TRINITY_DN62865_c0_g1_i1.p1  ORF type:complete len:142 (-),score=11.51 TRINITY_DN62865_c0_g1_i1:465-890(-)
MASHHQSGGHQGIKEYSRTRSRNTQKEKLFAHCKRQLQQKRAEVLRLARNGLRPQQIAQEVVKSVGTETGIQVSPEEDLEFLLLLEAEIQQELTQEAEDYAAWQAQQYVESEAFADEVLQDQVNHYLDSLAHQNRSDEMGE